MTALEATFPHLVTRVPRLHALRISRVDSQAATCPISCALVFEPFWDECGSLLQAMGMPTGPYGKMADLCLDLGPRIPHQGWRMGNRILALGAPNAVLTVGRRRAVVVTVRVRVQTQLLTQNPAAQASTRSTHRGTAGTRARMSAPSSAA